VESFLAEPSLGALGPRYRRRIYLNQLMGREENQKIGNIFWCSITAGRGFVGFAAISEPFFRISVPRRAGVAHMSGEVLKSR
jgi:hypothetical protein